MSRQWMHPFMRRTVLASSVTFITLLQWSISEGAWLATALLALMVSTGIRIALLPLEKWTLKQLFDLRYASWAFVVGDAVYLPVGLGAIAYGWRSLPTEGWYRDTLWSASAVMLGCGITALFFYWDRQNYLRQDALAALLSTSKWVHDFLSYPAFAISVVYGLVPLLVVRPLGSFWAPLLVGLLGWTAFAMMDTQRDPYCKKRHPAWDPLTFRRIPW